MENYESAQTNGKQIFWIIGGIIVVIMIIGIVYSATQKTLKKTGGESGALENTTALNNQLNEVKSAVVMVDVPATITGIDVVNLQTFPQKVQVRIKGTVPDGCSTFTTPVITESNKTFTITVTASHPKDAGCTQVVTNQEIVADLPVAGLPAGNYSVVLGKITKTFKLAADNQIQFSSDK